MRKPLLALVASVLVAAVTAGTAAASHSWADYHWARTSNPLALTIVDTTSAGWTSYVNTAVSDWDASTVLALAKTTGSADRRCKMLAGKAKVCAASYGYNGWLGLATINIDSAHHITQASTKLNDSYFNTSTYNNPNERQHVACQEIGHDFGLGHQDESGISLNTCMDYFSNTGANATNTASTHPNQHDYDQLVSIYSHVDSYSTASAAAAVNPGLAGNENASPVATERSDRIASSTITEHFADGTARITEIYWALDGPGR